ncbi:MAG: 3-hydroxyacyl-CoA dehydrogenase [Bacteroidetes bacterium SW_11_45_7]|nr:MAG: 3-hydroxyacyl-CoA dehydrogenase [Bacteroidetes bacterium SW_11_45_7]
MFMEVLTIGDQARRDLIDQKSGEAATVTGIDSDKGEEPQQSYSSFDAIFDLTADEKPDYIPKYLPNEGQPVFLGAVKQQLASLLSEHMGHIHCQVAGVNALPTFLERDRLELSIFDNNSRQNINNTLQTLQWDVEEVADRVGMVSPRIVFMIINEACFTLQEGTAGIDDINTAMKRGTNYPQGPFEWADATGIAHVYETLASVYHDTHDERYKVCPLLKTKYLRKEAFMR